MSAPDLDRLRDRAAFIRTETVRLITIAKSGHYTSVFSAAEILAALYYHVMRLDTEGRQGGPNWPDRDRLILSKGHVAVGVYPVLADLGFFPTEWLDNYARLGSMLGDHPDMRKVPGCDFSSGSLGHGLSIGVGMALGLRHNHSPGRVFVLLGDGELNEGQNWEAAQSAAHYRTGNLIGIIDRNSMGLDGRTEETMSIEPLADKWRAFNWNVTECDGHDVAALVAAFAAIPAAKHDQSDRPHMLIAHTVKGKGVAAMEDSRLWHLGHLAGDDAAAVIQEINTHAHA